MSLSLNGSGGIFGLDQGLNVTGVGTFQTLNVTGDLTVDGVLTYDDVTNIDSVGVVTARSGLHVTGGSVGIGTDNPICKLVVNSGTTNLATQIVSDDAEVFLAFKDGDSSGNQQVQIGGVGNNFVAYAGGNERLRITSDGNVGIGTQIPEGKFQVGSNGSSNVIITENIGVDINDGALNLYQATSNVNAAPFIISTDVGGTEIEKLRVSGAGSVGIGTDDPQTRLHISDNTVANARITISKFDTFRNNFIGLDNQADELVITVDDDNQGPDSSLRLKVDGAAVGTFTGTGVSFAQDLTLPGQERFKARKQTDQGGTDNNSLWVTFAGSNGTVDYDTHSGFSESDDWYEIQNSGYFMIYATVLITSTTSNSLRDYQMAICEFDGTSNTVLSAFTARASTTSDDDTHSMQATFLGNLVAGRKIRLRAFGNTDGGNYTILDGVNDGIGGAGLDVSGTADHATQFTVVKLG